MSLLQVCSLLSRLEDLVLLFSSVATSYCYCDNLLPFSMMTISRHILCIASNSYVTTSIIMSQHNFNAASASWCRDQSFHVTITSLFRLCCNIVLYYLHFCHDPKGSIMTQKVLSRQRLVATELDFLLQLCFLCCDLDFYVGHVLHVATSICYVSTTLFCMQQLFLSRHSFSDHDITFLPLAYLRVVTLISYRDKTFLCSTDFCVTTEIFRSQHQNTF